MKRSSGMIQGLALIALTVSVAAGGLTYLTHRQEKKLSPIQQSEAYRLTEPEARRLVEASGQIVRGDKADRVWELMGKPNHTVSNRSGMTHDSNATVQDHYYIISSSGPIVPYVPNPSDTCIVVGIGQDKKVSYVRKLNITGAIPGMRSGKY